MILSFSTKWPQRMTACAGQPNYFVEKILNSFKTANVVEPGIVNVNGLERVGYIFNAKHYNIAKPKLHTIRAGNRWRPGMKIHMAINNRSKDYLQFAPTIECVSVQDISILHASGHAEVKIDGEWFGEIYHYGLDDIHEYTNDLLTLVQNDGFESVEQLFTYFNQNFVGQIVHWTSLRY